MTTDAVETALHAPLLAMSTEELAALDDLAHLNPGMPLPALRRLRALGFIIDADDAETGYREPGEDDAR